MGKLKIVVAYIILNWMGVIWLSFMYQGSVCSDLNDIKVFLHDVLEKLDGFLRDEDLIFDLRLILNELIINSAIHGNQCNKDKTVDLYLEIIEDKIKIEVVDEGKGIDFERVSYESDELKCCGRGLVLVNGLSDEVYIDKNRVIAVKRIN